MHAPTRPTEVLVEEAIELLHRLMLLGEAVEDEWQYVHDLELVWTARLRAVAAARPLDESALDELRSAVEALAAETGRISDPHKAIDWLSTLPLVVLVALREAAW